MQIAPSQPSLFDLQGKVALITGASSGIGAQQALCLGKAGAKVVLLARSKELLQSSVQQLQAKGIQAKYWCADLLQIEDFAPLVTQVEALFGQVDILCNTAGVNLRQPPEQMTSASWDTTLRLNLKVPFFLAQALVPNMQARSWGRIINVASLQTSRAFPNGMAYGASKGGIGQLTRAMAEAWSSYGINCNAFAPGFFPTQLTQPVFEDTDLAQSLASKTAIGRNGQLKDLDGINLFLASHASDYVTGQVIYIDGGFTAL